MKCTEIVFFFLKCVIFGAIAVDLTVYLNCGKSGYGLKKQNKKHPNSCSSMSTFVVYGQLKIIRLTT